MIHVISTNEDASRLITRLWATTDPVGIDTETVGCDPRKQSPVNTGRVICFSISIPGTDLHPKHSSVRLGDQNFIWAEFLPMFKPWMESNRPKVGHNVWGYDYHVLLNGGIKLGGIVGDTLRMSRLLDASKLVRHGLKDRQKWVLGYEGLGSYSELFSRPADLKPKTYRETRVQQCRGVPTLQVEGTWPCVSWKRHQIIPLDRIREDYPQRLETLYEYATLDAKATLELYFFFRGRMQREGIEALHDKIWNPSMQCLADMARTGIGVNAEVLQEGALSSQKDATRIRGRLDKWQPDFENWSSGPQLQRLLYDKLKYRVPPVSGTAKAVRCNFEEKRSTDEAAIRWHITNSVKNDASAKDGLEALLEYRKAVKYGQFFANLATHSVDGRIHCQLAPDTDTGRLSCRNPNLQQIPASDPYHTRRAFVPAEGNSLLILDYRQLELYVLAHFLLEKFKDDKLASDLREADVHSATAKRCWPDQLASIPVSDIMEHENPSIRKFRADAKTINFAINYGKSASGLGYQIQDASGLPIGKPAAEKILERYFESYPGVKKFHAWAQGFAKKNGFVRTLLGRVRPLPGARYDDRADMRRALNTPIQGSAADIVTCAMVRCSRNKELDSLGVKAILQIHDELVFEAPTENAERAILVVTQCMERPLPKKQLLLPLKVSAKVCRSWEEGK